MDQINPQHKSGELPTEPHMGQAST